MSQLGGNPDSLDEKYFTSSTADKAPTLSLSPSETCTVENLPDCIVLVNQLLHSFGLPSVTPINLNGLDTDNAINVVTFLLSLLRQHDTDVQIQSELEEKNLRSSRQLDVLQTTVESLEAQKLEAERDAYSARFKGENLQAELKKTNQQLATTRADLQKTTAKAQSAKVQFAHDLRKKDAELDRLKATLQKNTTDRGVQSKFGIEVINPPGKVAKPATEEPAVISKTLVEMYKQREKELAAENYQLRTILFTLEKSLKTEIRFTEEGEQLGGEQQPKALDEAQLKMPFEVIKGSIETSAKDLVDQIKQEAVTFKESLMQSTYREQSEQIYSLEKQLEEFKQVIEEQEKLIELNLEMTSADAGKTLPISFEDAEAATEELERIKSQLREQKQQLEVDRKEFTKAAIELGRERTELSKARAALEEEKRGLTTEQFLLSLPKTPQWVLKAINKSGNGDLEKITNSPTTPGFQKFLARISAHSDDVTTPPATGSGGARLTFEEDSPTKKKAAIVRSLVDSDENLNPNI